MPKATVSLEPETRELTTAPPDGFVTLKRMSYGQIIERRSMLSIGFETDARSKDIKGELAMANKQVTAYEFANCVVDHNLEDEDGRKLNLATPEGLSKLDPKVGQEIEFFISAMNNFDEAEQGN